MSRINSSNSCSQLNVFFERSERCTFFQLVQELLPEGRSFDSVGRPLEVHVAFQRLVNDEALAKQLWHGALNGDLPTVTEALTKFQDPNAQDEQGELLGRAF